MDYRCLVCAEFHILSACEKFRKMNDRERMGVVFGKAICQNCLKLSHRTHTCQWQNKCKICKCRHHGLLHGMQTLMLTARDRIACIPTTLQTVHGTGIYLRNTAIVLVVVGLRRWPLRVCIEENQDISAIQSSTLERLGVTPGANRMVHLYLESRQDPHFSITGVFAVDDGSYGCLPVKCVNKEKILNAFPPLGWADTDFAESKPIEAILGGRMCDSIMLPYVLKEIDMPTARASAFGWTLAGIASPLEL